MTFHCIALYCVTVEQLPIDFHNYSVSQNRFSQVFVSASDGIPSLTWLIKPTPLGFILIHKSNFGGITLVHWLFCYHLTKAISPPAFDLMMFLNDVIGNSKSVYAVVFAKPPWSKIALACPKTKKRDFNQLKWSYFYPQPVFKRKWELIWLHIAAAHLTTPLIYLFIYLPERGGGVFFFVHVFASGLHSMSVIIQKKILLKILNVFVPYFVGALWSWKQRPLTL